MTKALKPVLKRPWQHHVIILCYVAAPFVNIILVKVFLHVSFRAIFVHLTAGYGSSRHAVARHRAPCRNCALLREPVRMVPFPGPQQPHSP